MDDARVIRAILTVLCAVVCFWLSETRDSPSRTYGCIMSPLRNGIVGYRGRNRLVKYKCRFGYTLIGDGHAMCIRGQWNRPKPVCASPTGCESLDPPQHGFLLPGYNGALMYYKCDPGYSLIGAFAVYCDGAVWNGTTPLCIPAMSLSTSCDFEEGVLCGWSQDTKDDFDWNRNRFSTPSGRGTGPSYDHTFGIGRAGHYMYIEASAPRRINDTARLFSPVFWPGFAPPCFTFWYHMFGATIGSLRVYVKKDDEDMNTVQPVWTRNGEQGPNWLHGVIPIPSMQRNFQVVIEGVRGDGFFGDIAIDDISLRYGSCEVDATTQTTELPTTTVFPTTTVTSQPTTDVTTESTRGELPLSVIVTDSTILSTTAEQPITYQTTESTDLFTSTQVYVTDTPISSPSVSDVITPSQLRSIDSNTSSTASTTTTFRLKGNTSTIPSKYPGRTQRKKALPQVSKSPSGGLLAVIIVVAVLISLIGAALFIYFKRYRFRKDKLSEDSDMRYLSSSEEIEYVDNYRHSSSLHELTVT